MNIRKNVNWSIEVFDDYVKYFRFLVGGEVRSKIVGGGIFVGFGKELFFYVFNFCLYYFLFCFYKLSV